MRTTLCLIFALALTACGGSSDTPATPDKPAVEEAVKPPPAVAPAVVAEPAPAAAAGGGNAEAGKAIYMTFCMACHQADGKAMGGALGANFVEDETRLSKTDEQLLASIEKGIEGTTMIAWGSQLDEQKRKDVLAYIRATYGK